MSPALRRLLLATATLLLVLLGAPVAGAAPAPAAGTAGRVTMTITNMCAGPSCAPIPAPSATTQPLTFTVQLVNTTGKAIPDITLSAAHTDWIDSQQQLTQVLATNTVAPDSAVGVGEPVQTSLPAGTTPVSVTYRATVGIPKESDLCLCASNALYPVYFAAENLDDNGAVSRLATARTFVSSFWNVKVATDTPFTPARPAQVSWVWPLLDRPHRLLDGSVFTDDDLATEVDPTRNGRLARALQVVVDVLAARPGLPLTLVVDPELLDELSAMATGKYTVVSLPTPGAAQAAPRPGTGAAAAQAWLDQFERLLRDNRSVQVYLTAFGDPDVQSLTAQGLGWTAGVPPSMAQAVGAALPQATGPASAPFATGSARLFDTSTSWPSSTGLSTTTVAELAAKGTTHLLLPGSAVTRSTDAGGLPLSSVELPDGVTAALTSSAMQGYAATAMRAGGGENGAALQLLLAEIAIQPAEQPDRAHLVVLSPPRYVDPDVTSAVHTILTTSTSAITAPAPLSAVFTGSTPAPATLAPVPASSPHLSPNLLDRASGAHKGIGVLGALLIPSVATDALITYYSDALQRSESAGFGVDSPVTAPGARGGAYVRALDQLLHDERVKVHIVKPSSGSYTLASSNAPLPVTVENDLAYPVRVEVRVETRNGVPGFTARPVTQVIDPGRRTLRIPAKVDRSGRIEVRAELRTAGSDGVRIGDAIPLTVHSTVLGLVGVIITIVAGAVLALALLVRLAVRWRRRRAKVAAA